MKRVLMLLWAVAAMGGLLVRATPASAEEDVKGSKDHPLLSRMPGYHISEYKEEEFAAYTFYDSRRKNRDVKVEGRKYSFTYTVDKDEKPKDGLQLMRNFQNAIKKIGGVITYEYGTTSIAQIVKGNAETWVYFQPPPGRDYYVTVVEKAAMEQEMVANAEALGSGLTASGHAVVEGILFNTGKSEIKPESEAALAEVAKLLAKQADLKVRIIGHTDNVGNLVDNLKLSQARAEAVTSWLTGKGKIAASRLAAHGIGSLAPVATNRTEEGRKQNRRVEIVEQ